MGQSFYVYNSGDLRRKDNTLQFTNAEGEKKDIPIERIDDKIGRASCRERV